MKWVNLMDPCSLHADKRPIYIYIYIYILGRRFGWMWLCVPWYNQTCAKCSERPLELSGLVVLTVT